VSDPGEQQLLLSDWLVLCVVCEQPTHGFAVAGLFSREGSLGRVWQISKPAVYAAMARLERLGLVQMAGEQRTSQGPARSLVEATRAGRTAARRWLYTPVAHGRDVRSELMIKLALLERAGDDPKQLLGEQRAKLAPLAAALANRVHTTTGIEHTLALWRHQAMSATIQFLDDVTRQAELASAADQAATSSHAAFPATGPA
jgi:DNA-binding PadR family transcriptional regulator